MDDDIVGYIIGGLVVAAFIAFFLVAGVYQSSAKRTARCVVDGAKVRFEKLGDSPEWPIFRKEIETGGERVFGSTVTDIKKTRNGRFLVTLTHSDRSTSTIPLPRCTR